MWFFCCGFLGGLLFCFGGFGGLLFWGFWGCSNFHANIHLRFKHAVLGTHFGYLDDLSRTVI